LTGSFFSLDENQKYQRFLPESISFCRIHKQGGFLQLWNSEKTFASLHCQLRRDIFSVYEV
jgi:hypothetical protein